VAGREKAAGLAGELLSGSRQIRIYRIGIVCLVG
jgi:hypothetical protein